MWKWRLHLSAPFNTSTVDTFWIKPFILELKSVEFSSKRFGLDLKRNQGWFNQVKHSWTLLWRLFHFFCFWKPNRHSLFQGNFAVADWYFSMRRVAVWDGNFLRNFVLGIFPMPEIEMFWIDVQCLVLESGVHTRWLPMCNYTTSNCLFLLVVKPHHTPLWRARVCSFTHLWLRLLWLNWR